MRRAIPCLSRHGAAIETAPRLRWIGYLSTTGVYGDRDGALGRRGHRARARVRSQPAAAGGRAGLAATWPTVRGRYVPAGRHLRAAAGRRSTICGRGRRGASCKPGHAFGRIHRDDIVRAVLTAMRQERRAAPACSTWWTTSRRRAPRWWPRRRGCSASRRRRPVPFEHALATMSPMARSFWAENRKVSSRRDAAALGLRWRYPSYREGLRAILAEERGERPA